MSESAPPPKSTRRRALGLAAAWLLILGICLWLFTGGGETFVDRFGRLREGMTKAEVHALVGPPGDNTTPNARWIGFAIVGPPLLGHPNAARLRTAEAWRNDHGDFYVGYDGEGKVAALRANPCREPMGLLGRFTEWAHRQFGPRRAVAMTMTLALPTAPPRAPLPPPASKASPP